MPWGTVSSRRPCSDERTRARCDPMRIVAFGGPKFRPWAREAGSIEGRANVGGDYREGDRVSALPRATLQAARVAVVTAALHHLCVICMWVSRCPCPIADEGQESPTST